MAVRLADCSNGKDNNFNLIRLLAAMAVLVSHAFPLSGHADDEPLPGLLGLSLGEIGVDVFFVISGFLVARSFFERGNLLAFVWARILRIYPALIVSVLLCVFVVGACFTTLSLTDYLGRGETHQFLLRNSLLFKGVEYGLPGVFEDLPLSGAVNGSIWTLSYELRMYAWLALIGTLTLYARRLWRLELVRPLFALLAVGAVAANILNHLIPFASGHGLRLFSMFFFGAGLYLHREWVVLSRLGLSLMLLALGVAVLSKAFFYILYALLLPFVILHLAYVPAGPVRAFNRLGDYSYGLYIHAFPVQQSLVALVPGISSGQLILASCSITLALAVLSWHLLEQVCMERKGRYVLLQQVLHRWWLGVRTHGSWSGGRLGDRDRTT